MSIRLFIPWLALSACQLALLIMHHAAVAACIRLARVAKALDRAFTRLENVCRKLERKAGITP